MGIWRSKYKCTKMCENNSIQSRDT